MQSIVEQYTHLEKHKITKAQRWVQYARFTIPSVYRDDYENESSDSFVPADSIGAQCVNHLSNKITQTLFGPAPFFRCVIRDDDIQALTAAAKRGDAKAKDLLNTLDETLAQKERAAMMDLNYSNYRTIATAATDLLLITGNALVYDPPGAPAQVYSPRDYVIERDTAGNVLTLITRDRKAVERLPAEIQDRLLGSVKYKNSKTKDNVTLYTRVVYRDGKYHMDQSIEDIALDSFATWTETTNPYVPLTWKLHRGEHWGRGLVEEYAGAFNAVEVLSQAWQDLVGMAADIKVLVRPGSQLNVREMNESPRGSFHAGTKEDLSVAELIKLNDVSMISAGLERYTRQLSQAFMLNSSMVRDAERVTTEEIRFIAQQLETAHGGVYSRFANEWQYRVAVLHLTRVGLEIGGTLNIEPVIITGLDGLSRAGDLDNLYMFIADMSRLNGLPPDVLQTIDFVGYAKYVGLRRGVDIEKFVKSNEQLQQEQMAAEQAQMNQMGAQAAMGVAQEAGKSLVKQ